MRILETLCLVRAANPILLLLFFVFAFFLSSLCFLLVVRLSRRSTEVGDGGGGRDDGMRRALLSSCLLFTFINLSLGISGIFVNIFFRISFGSSIVCQTTNNEMRVFSLGFIMIFSTKIISGSFMLRNNRYFLMIEN